MLIRELEKQTGLERATIRYYEKEGLITPHREDNGYRTYSNDDRETLLKVKLLRQLGMPLEKIKGLQQGSEAFSDALNEQIASLEKQIRDSVRAREVCEEMRDRAESYDTLDARYYLIELTKPSANADKWEPKPVPEFHRAVPVHPWKRYFARMIDLSIIQILLQLIVIVVLRIRPINGLLYTILDYAIVSHLLMIPVEGLLLHYWGTTPGKWIMGIRIESVNGGNLSVTNAMMRSFDVLRSGYGFTIPIYYIWRLYQSYKSYCDDFQTEWDQIHEAEPVFEYYYSPRKIAAMILAVLVLIGCNLYTTNDGLKTVHRGDTLSVAQVAENYNDLVEMMANRNKTTPSKAAFLDPEGKWVTSESVNTSSNAVVIIGSQITSNYPGPEFTVENGAVRKIVYKASYKDVLRLSLFGERPSNLVLSVALGQDWLSLLNYNDFIEKFSEAIQAKEGTFIYENLEVVWSAKATNCIFTGTSFYTEDNTKPSTVDITIEIYIHESE